MKKRSILLIILLMLFCVSVENVKADGPSCHIQIGATDTVGIGEVVSFDLGVDQIASNSDIYGIHYIIEYDPKILEPISVKDGGVMSYLQWENISTRVEETDGWPKRLIIDAKTSNKNKYAINGNFDNEPYVKLVNVKFKVLATEENRTSIELMSKEDYIEYEDDEDGYSYTYEIFNDDYSYEYENAIFDYPCWDNLKVFIKIVKKNDDVTLKSLTVDKGSLSPKFKKDVKFYTVDVDNDVNVINIKATCNGKNCKVTGTGTKELKEGNNSFDIVVNSENGDSSKYTVNVIRGFKENDAILKSLTVSDGILTPNFAPEINSYKLEVDNNIEQIELNAQCSGKKCSLSGVGKKQLEIGNNQFIINVKSESGNENEYKIVVVRKDKETTTTTITTTTKKENNDDKDNGIIIIIILIVIIISVIVGTYFILKKKNKDKVKKTTNTDVEKKIEETSESEEEKENK